MDLTDLEKSVIQAMLTDPELNPTTRYLGGAEIRVETRDYSGAGFLTKLTRSDGAKLFADEQSFVWGKVGARLNRERLHTGYLVYVEHGWLTALEGYTYGEDWPSLVEEYEVYRLREGIGLDDQ